MSACRLYSPRKASIMAEPARLGRFRAWVTSELIPGPARFSPRDAVGAVSLPHHGSELMILNKIDLLPYLQFDVERCLDFARLVNPHLRVLQLSTTRGDGLEHWYGWLREKCPRLASS